MPMHCYPPYGLLSLAAQLRQGGHRVNVIDANAFRMDDETIVGEVAAEGPGLVGIPLMSELLHHVHGLTGTIKERCPDIRIILGGPEVNARPEEVLNDFGSADFVMKGESERALVLLCDRIRDNQSLDDVPGLLYRLNHTVHRCRSVDPMENLDGLEYPAWDLLAEAYRRKKYYTVMLRRRPIDGIMTSRGCPYHCRFCYSHNHRYRTRSPESVVEELIAVRNNGIRFIRFIDDTFTLDRDRAMKIFDRIIEENVPVKLGMKSRADMVDTELLKKARRAGVIQVYYGMESGVQYMLDAMGKGTTVDDIVNACTWTRQAGIRCHASWVVGYPGETPETIAQTTMLIRKLKPTTVTMNVLHPYPETEVYKEAKENGTLMGDWSVHDNSIPWIKLPWIDNRDDLIRCADAANRKIFLRPHYMLMFTKMMLKDSNLTMARYGLQELNQYRKKR
ncbi:B12-binding domain-containing radical SAM protein [Thermodesulfobacteriota bacterium]